MEIAINFTIFTGIIAKFPFSIPDDDDDSKGQSVDADGDLVVKRRRRNFLRIEHSQSTILQLVGLQVWRGAFLLNDYVLHYRDLFRDKCVLELGSGVGITGILAAIYCKEVFCTDLNIGGILELIRANVEHNRQHLQLQADIQVQELDFKNCAWDPELVNRIKRTDFVLAADTIYDDEITAAFCNTINGLFGLNSDLKMLVALEKRYVFTLSDMDSVAPCFVHFLRVFEQKCSDRLRIEFIPIDTLPQYFEYDRVKQLVLMKIVKK